jgi:hypothetical protein
VEAVDTEVAWVEAVDTEVAWVEAVDTEVAWVEAASMAVAFMEASLAVGSTVEDFTVDFTDVRLWGLALDPTTTDTIPTHTTTTTTMAAATSSVAACIPDTAGGFVPSKSADDHQD